MRYARICRSQAPTFTAKLHMINQTRSIYLLHAVEWDLLETVDLAVNLIAHLVAGPEPTWIIDKPNVSSPPTHTISPP